MRKILGKVRKVMKINEESYKKKLKTIWGKIRKAMRKLGKIWGNVRKVMIKEEMEHL